MTTKQRVNETYFEKGIKMLIMNNFPNFSRFSYIAEVRRYKTAEVKEIWEQENNMLPQIVEIYFDGEFLCDVIETMDAQQVLSEIEKQLFYKVTSKNKKNRGSN